MIEKIYQFSETLIGSFSSFVDFVTTKTVGNYSILEVILGVGITAFVGFVVAKWVIDFIP